MWRDICVVGVGGHARSKLIPAIEANGQALAGLVSGQPTGTLPNAPVFVHLEEALAALPVDTLFLLASPPVAHAAQVRAVLAAGRDCLVEKPGFVTAAQAREATALAGSAVLAEAFMQRHTALYAWWLERWAQLHGRIAALDATFVVPALPPSTFRATGGVASSSLYDIGCYVVALLGDLALDPAGLAIAEVAGSDALTERVKLAGALAGGGTDEVAVTATIGVAPDYANRVTLTLRNGERLSAAPFFYGRPGERRVETAGGGLTLDEGDAFCAMLARPRAVWLADQPARLARMIAATATLERLGTELAMFRARAPDLH